jgi:muramoyltetrapeptide carboxypeptidase
VVCYTGGWGSPRVLPYLDYDLIRRRPKVLIGYSDITALLNAVHKKTGLITFHGPVGSSTFDPFTLENFRRVVMTADPAGLLPTPSKNPNELVDRTNRILKITPGKATGPLIGGNLTMIATLMGIPYQPDNTNAIVFLEDVHEELYRIDRMLTTLTIGGLFEKAAGIIFGRCSDCGVKRPQPRRNPLRPVWFVICPRHLRPLLGPHRTKVSPPSRAPEPRWPRMRAPCGWRRGCGVKTR